MTASYSEALAAAHAAAGSQDYPKGCLYVVATPIGNLADISLRALHLLSMVDAIACEDTRQTQALLRALGLTRRGDTLLALHEHNEHEAATRVLARLQAGERMALVSDAGTPAISDPGARLVAAVHAAGLRVMPLPGASSVTAAISAAGAVGAADSGFVFAGFLPARGAARAERLRQLAQEPRAVVLLEAPHRIEELLASLAALASRRLTIGRELTKQFEEVATMAAGEAGAWLAADPNRLKGEFVLVLHPAEVPASAATDTRVLSLLMAQLPLKTAVQLAAEISGQPRNALYEAALRIRSTA